MRYRRPPGWKQWAEVVWRDEHTPHFIGDLPHTWVGSDFVRSVLDMLAYDRERDSAVVVAAGVPAAWLQGPGVRVRGLGTPYGALGYTMRATDRGVEVRIEGGLRVPPGGIVVKPPRVTGAWKATVNGAAAPVSEAGEVLVRELPAEVALGP
jgi:hypothetical protein